MALLTQYDSSDAYLSQEDYDNLEPEDKEFREPDTYDEDLDQMYYDDFKYDVQQAFSKRKFPLVLEAVSSNWRGQTGTKECDNTEDVLDGIMSFESASIELHRGQGRSLWFVMGGTHDCPLGFHIKVCSGNTKF